MSPSRRFTLFAVLLTLAAPVVAQPPGDLQIVNLGITPNSTVLGVRHAGDGSGRLFLIERDGTISIVDDGTLLPTPFLDIESDVDTFFEGGLLGLAFHPDYATNGYFYVHYTRDGAPLVSVIDRFTVLPGNPNVADLGSREEIFTLAQPAGNHNGGDLHFSPVDGYLYFAIGDGGASSSTSQNQNNLLGKIMRIDPCDDPGCVIPYEIPADNPNVGQPEPDEIWGSGLRNPYRFSFDRTTGDIFIADVGSGSREEVSFQPFDSAGGENYGWNCREGDIAGPGGCSGTFVEPVMVYTHGGGNCSISGGYRYRGCIAGFQGTYVFGDFCTGRVWFGTEDTPGNWSFSEWDDLSGSVYGFGEDEDGELYIARGSSVYRFESPSSCTLPTEIFEDGFESGDTSAWSSTLP